MALTAEIRTDGGCVSWRPLTVACRNCWISSGDIATVKRLAAQSARPKRKGDAKMKEQLQFRQWKVPLAPPPSQLHFVNVNWMLHNIYDLFERKSSFMIKEYAQWLVQNQFLNSTWLLNILTKALVISYLHYSSTKSFPTATFFLYCQH